MFSGNWDSDCDKGLVAWLPVKAPSEYEANGLVVARQSHNLHQQLVTNGTWASYLGSLSGQLRILQLYKHIGDTFPLLRTQLDPGDVVLFSKCSVHSSSGKVHLCNLQDFGDTVEVIPLNSSVSPSRVLKPNRLK